MKRRSSYKKKSSFKMVSSVLLLALLGGAAYLYTSPEFEREAPQIKMPKSTYWNGRAPLEIAFEDNEGLKAFEITLSDGLHTIMVGKGEFPKGTKSQTLMLKYPTNTVLDKKAKALVLEVKVNDSSYWNFFEGNHATKKERLTMDFQRPNVNILSNSRSINQGGSALVVFQALDENLKELYIEANHHTFKPTPYKRDGYYASLIAWPFTEEGFDAKIIATDKAGNRRETHIPLYHHNPKYRTSYIRASDKFIDGKITDLAFSNPDYADIDDKLKRLKAINETMRLKNENLIHSLAVKVSDERIDSWKMRRFYPLKNAKKVASFGDHRYYYYGSRENVVSESYHLGYDLASTKMAPIMSSNSGKVVFAAENGIYGNMPMIDHGLGLYTLYGHCSQLLVKEGDSVHAGEVIARTGMSGLALGDHLHFGILVQGIEVRPVEWFDKGWIQTNIDDVFKVANKIIDMK